MFCFPVRRLLSFISVESLINKPCVNSGSKLGTNEEIPLYFLWQSPWGSWEKAHTKLSYYRVGHTQLEFYQSVDNVGLKVINSTLLKKTGWREIEKKKKGNKEPSKQTNKIKKPLRLPEGQTSLAN